MKPRTVELVDSAPWLEAFTEIAKGAGKSALEDAIKLAWLRWQVSPEFLPISDVLAGVVHRSVEPSVVKKHAGPVKQDLYERALIYCAVLSGDIGAMKTAAKVVRGAARHRKDSLNDESVAGILKGRIEGNPKFELQQYRLSEKSVPHRAHAWPSQQLLKAFVERDYGQLALEVERGAKQHWSDSYLKGARGYTAIVKETDDLIVLDPMKKGGNFLWAYVEAVFAKMAMMDGATITYDDLWFPLRLIRAAREESSVPSAVPHTPQEPKPIFAVPKDKTGRTRSTKKRN